jgi:hypothetical protein
VIVLATNPRGSPNVDSQKIVRIEGEHGCQGERAVARLAMLLGLAFDLQDEAALAGKPSRRRSLPFEFPDERGGGLDARP